MAFTLTSPAFSEGGAIPSEHSCDGGDKPIPLAWSGVPDGASELALIMDDPDARGFVQELQISLSRDHRADSFACQRIAVHDGNPEGMRCDVRGSVRLHTRPVRRGNTTTRGH